MPPKRSDAAVVIGNNEDLATEILLRLPAKSVVKFKTVSKQWLSIVWCRRFRQTHAFRQGANPTALGIFLAKPESEFPWRSPYSSFPSRPTNGGIEFLSLNGTDDQILPNSSVFSFFEYTKVNIRSSCNGLLLLGSVSTYRHISPRYDRMYYVFNPTTMEFNDIAIPAYMRSLACVNETLCFDPSKSPHYKILFLRKRFYDLDIEIYSSDTGACKWQKVKYLASPNNCIGVPGIFCNGAIYWMSREKTLYFDMDTKGLKEFQLPPQKGTHGMICYFGESRGRLHLVRVDTDLSLTDQCPILDVYEFKNQEWFLKCQVNLDSFAIGIPQIISESSGAYQYAVLGIACDEAGELTMALIVYDLFVAYNLDKDTIKVLCNVMPRGSSFMYDGWRSAHMCIQSLACL